MSAHLETGTTPLDLEALPERERAQAELHLAGCAACATELAEGGEALAALAASLPAEPLPTTLWARVEATVRATNRFERFVERTARLLDVTLERARALLAAIDDLASWVPGLPGVSVYHLEGGPATAGAITGFIKLEPGAIFPQHSHLGDERTIVLQGSCTSGGRTVRAGEDFDMAEGTSHSVQALEGPAFVFVVVAHGGIEVSGQQVGPDDPRL